MNMTLDGGILVMRRSVEYPRGNHKSVFRSASDSVRIVLLFHLHIYIGVLNDMF